MREVISLQTTIFLLVWIGYVVKKRKIIGSQGQKNLNGSRDLCDLTM